VRYRTDGNTARCYLESVPTQVYALVNAPFDTESPPAKYSVFALVLGCVFLSILITGGTLMTTRLFLYLSGLQ